MQKRLIRDLQSVQVHLEGKSVLLNIHRNNGLVDNKTKVVEELQIPAYI